MIDRLTCLLCPVGCELEVEESEGRLEVRGHQCEKGIGFAEQEVLHPLRNPATSVPLTGAEATMVSVRLSAPIPRDLIFQALAEMAKIRPELPVRRGQVLLRNVLGTGADVLATRSVYSVSPFLEPKNSGPRGM